MNIQHFEVRRDDLRESCCLETRTPDLRPGEVLFRVDRFAYTANNVTYGVAGDSMGYWSFFPAASGWGRIPAMGFADVVASRHPEVAEGERCFGWYPMSTHLLVSAERADAEAFFDASPARAETAAGYRRYARVAQDFLHDPEREDPIALLRGLYTTSFLVDDSIQDEGLAPDAVWITSASSKTSLALAFQVAGQAGVRSVGLTSAGNRDFVTATGLYDEVRSYDEIAEVSAAGRHVLVDMAGNGTVLAAVHRHLGDALVKSLRVGFTHWEAGEVPGDLVGPEPAFFFAPTQLQKRMKEWGREGFQERFGDAWQRFVAHSDGWLQVVHGHGAKAVERVHRAMVEGNVRPQEGHILSLHER